MNPDDIRLRTATAADYDQIIAVVDDWWGRPIRHALARVFLDHFHATSTIAEATAESERRAGRVPHRLPLPVGTGRGLHPLRRGAPRLRGNGLARILYQRFFALAEANDRHRVSAITAPQNAGSIAFHTAMGFTVTPPIPDYDGQGSAKVLFQRRL